MTWWKKILQTIPLLVAGYEVGKSQEETDNKELVEILKHNIGRKDDSSIDKSNALNYTEIISIMVIVILAIIYIIRIVCKAIGNRRQQQVQAEPRI